MLRNLTKHFVFWSLLTCIITHGGQHLYVTAATCAEVSINHGEGQASQKPPYQPGTVLSFQCDAGYEGVGSAKITCKENGAWSADPPTCKATNCGGSHEKSGDKSGEIESPSDIISAANCIWSLSPPDDGKEYYLKFQIDHQGMFYSSSDGSKTCTASLTVDGTEEPCDRYLGLTDEPYCRVLYTSETCSTSARAENCVARQNLLNTSNPIVVKSSFPVDIVFLSPGSKIWARYFRGFLARYEFKECPKISQGAEQDGKCQRPQDIDQGQTQFSDSSFNENSQASYSCNQGYRLVGDSQRVCLRGSWSGAAPRCEKRKCRSIRRAASGQIKSPGYPGTLYDDNVRCEFVIISKKGHFIEITFTDFRLQKPAQDGKKTDFVEITEKTTQRGSITKTYHGTKNTPFTYVSSSTRVSVLFVTDESVRRKGFNATYRQVKACSRPTVPNGGSNCNPLGTDELYSQCKIACDAGYTLTGKTPADCNDGKWVNPPSCKLPSGGVHSSSSLAAVKCQRHCGNCRGYKERNDQFLCLTCKMRSLCYIFDVQGR